MEVESNLDKINALIKVLWLAGCLLLLNTYGFAAPLTEYGAGHASVDLAVSFPDTQAVPIGAAIVAQTPYGWNYGGEIAATIGVTPLTAVRFQQSGIIAPLNRSTYGNFYYRKSSYDALIGLKSDIWPLFLAAYAGWLDINIGQNIDQASTTFSQGAVHFGLLTSVGVCDKIAAYGHFGYGDLETEAGLGLSYAINRNVECNVELDYNALHSFASIMQQYNLSIFAIQSLVPKIGITYKF